MADKQDDKTMQGKTKTDEGIGQDRERVIEVPTLDKIVGIWEEGDIEEWEEEEETKYFNEIAKYAMQRIMTIKRKQSKLREENEQRKTELKQNGAENY